MGFHPELGSTISGGDFLDYFHRPEYQKVAVTTSCQKLESGGSYPYGGLYKCVRSVRSRDLTQSALNYVICAALKATVSLTSPCN